MHAEANRFLESFGNISIPNGGSGITRAREAVDFNPGLLYGEGELLVDWSADLGKSLFPIGHLDHGRFSLAIDAVGEIFALSDWASSFGVGSTALEKLILGEQGELVAE